MSLLDSIFGGETAKSKGASSLFEKPQEFPSKKKRSLEKKADRTVDEGTSKSKQDKKKRKKDEKEEVVASKQKESDSDSDSDESSSKAMVVDSKQKTETAIDKKSSTKKKKQKASKSSSSDSDSESSSSSKKEQDDAKKDTVDKKEQAEQPASNETEEEEEALAEASPPAEDADDRTVFVGNLPASFTRKGLEKMFRECGPIESTRIRFVATTGVKIPQSSAGNQKMVKRVAANLNKVDTEAKPSVVGYVVFKKDDNPDTVQQCVEKALKMNNTLVEDPSKTSGPRRIRVDHTKTEYDTTRSIFVGNLPYRTDEETLRRHFCDGCGIPDEHIEGIRVVRDKESYQCKGFAYILFQDKSHVSTALRLMHGSVYMKKDLRVLVCKKKYNSNPDAGRPKHKKSKHDDLKPGVAALRRIMDRETEGEKPKKRLRGTKKSKDKMAHSTGKSRRAAAEAKTNKRVKKIEKRITKGMGKSKNS